jgi:tRNA pseudouridine38-40 synthase
MRIKIVVQYDGSNYSGWQLQSGQDSIQGRLEAVLARVFSEPIRVHGSGRTDAGVHALGQVAAFDIPRDFDPDELNRAMNAMLPRDIVVLAAAAADANFDPRRDARSRVYEYRINTERWPSPFEYRYCWSVRDPLDVDRMHEAARQFVGEHDFASFRTLGSDEKSTIRRVLMSEWTRDANRMAYRVEATSFMRHMVRTMVATMIEIGRGRYAPEFVRELLDARDRALAPASAPPSGLFLIRVRY